MKHLTVISACALLVLSTAAFAQNNTSDSKSLQQNASPNGADATHAKQSGAPNTESGPSGTEGRAGATDSNGGTGKETPKMQGDSGTTK
jgi:hypothetical protein